MPPFFYLESIIVQAEASTDGSGVLGCGSGAAHIIFGFSPGSSDICSYQNGHQRSRQDNDDPSEGTTKTWKKLEVPPLRLKFKRAH